MPAADPAGPPAETWQQPDYGAPPPSGPPQRSWPIVALIGAVVLLVVAIIGVVATSGGGDDTVTGTDDSTDTSGEPGEPDTTEGPDTTDEPDGPQEPSGNPGAFVDEEGGYEITLTDGWAYTSLHDDPSGAGEAMFPDDSEKAGLIQQTVGVLPRAITFYGVVAEEVGVASFVTNVNINATPAPGAEALGYEEFSGQINQGIELIGATVTGDAPFELAGVEGVRVEFDYDAALGASGVQYASVVDGELWVVNFASSDVAGLSAEFDEIASSFRVTG